MRGRWARLLEATLVVALLAGGGALRLRVARGWQFAGTDSYGYLQLADELVRDHRFALGPPPEPLHYYRRPLYPAFLALVKGAAPLDPAGGPGWERIKRAQIAVDLLILCPLVWLVARRLGGRVAGLGALALAVAWPTSVLYASAALTESLAMTLTMLALAPLILVEDRRRAVALAGVGVALAALLRPEGLLLGLALVPRLAVERPWRRAAALAAVAALAFLVGFAWWPARNLERFGRLHLADGMIDRHSREVPHYLGFWRWLSSWSADERAFRFPQACFYDPVCYPTPELLDTGGAYETEAERYEVMRLLALRATHGLCAAVSDGFLRLAEARAARHPFAVRVGLPLARAWHMWLTPESELLQQPTWRPWLAEALRPRLPRLTQAFFAATVLAALALLGCRRTSLGAAVLLTPLAARTLALGYTGFSLPRYLVPTYPITFVLVGAALGLVWARLRAAARRG